jgi:solute carrier family 8 (sodium/calcium exchanger)
VGSAAFNYFIIVGLCIGVVPSPETRRIDHIYVFWTTLIFSIFAYIWLYLILAVISEGVVELWEGVLTFLFFFVTVLMAYAVDRKLFGVFGNRRFLSRAPHAFTARQHVAKKSGEEHVPLDDAAEYDQQRNDYINIFKQLRAANPDAPIGDIETLAQQEALKRVPKSRAFYRIKATRKLIGAGDVTSKKSISDKIRDTDLSVTKPMNTFRGGIVEGPRS